ncbi:flagellar hook-length control protein FliK [Paenarthrobacter sp. NCHU4564]|uniref:flagellar hook-length control protein FliK n=1 Tax=Paenarthrobacter sp. NCHU4564 TaxID=3451353 RepID=UPI003F9C6C97
MQVASFFAGGVQAGSGAPAGPGAAGASGPLDAAAFDAILGALLRPLPSAGALQAEAAPVSAAATPAAPVSAAAPPAAPVFAAAPADAPGTGSPATEASAKENPAAAGSAEAMAYLVASLPGMPYALQDLQRGIKPGQALAAGEALAGDAGAGVLSRSDESPQVGRLLASSPQQGIEPAGVSADLPLASVGATPGGTTGGTPARTGSAEATQDQFVGSLPGVPLARHDLQPGIESGQGIAARDPGAAATPDVDDSLPARRLLPAGAQVSVEGGKAGATGMPGPGTASAMLDGAQGSAFPQESTPAGRGAGSPLSDYAPAATDGIAAEATEPESKTHNGVPVFGGQLTRKPGIEPADAASIQPAPGVPQPATPGVPAPTQAAPAVVLHAQPHPGMQPQPPTPHQPLTHQLAQPLFTLASGNPGEHVMTVQVSPEDLGPLTVRAHIDGAGVRIELFASGEAGREAVRHVLLELRRGLEDAGASLSLSSHNNPQDTPKDTGAGNRHNGQTGYQSHVRSGPTEAPETAPSPQHAQSPNQLDILV